MMRLDPVTLRGEVVVPPSKSLSHRALIAAGLSEGECRISPVIFSEDISATAEGLRGMGCRMEKEGPETDHGSTLRVQGIGMPALLPESIDCRESGSTLRFLLPITRLSEKETSFLGRGKLVERPLEEYYRLFERQGIFYENQGGKLPLTTRGRWRGGEFSLRGDVSSQFISGLLMSLPLLEKDSEILLTTELESASYVELTMQVLAHFGIRIEKRAQGNYFIPGGQRYQARDYRIEGDFSQAAFWLVAGAISQDEESGIHCLGLKEDSLQGDRAVVDILGRIGAYLEYSGEGGLRVRPGRLRGTEVDARDIPDLVPVLAVALCLSEGSSVIRGIRRLRLKESDRISTTVKNLSALGAKIREIGDEIHIEGLPSLRGGEVSSYGDHRLAMAMAVASTRCREEVRLFGEGDVAKSYPHFFEDFGRLSEKNGG